MINSRVGTVREQQGPVAPQGKWSWESVAMIQIRQCPLRQGSPTAPELGKQGSDSNRS